jgi:ribosome maturation factor RimP
MDQQKQNNQPKAYAKRVPSPGQNRIAEQVCELITPVVTDLGYTLWDVAYVKEGADHILRITIDRESGITVDDCEAVSHAVDPVLDGADPIQQSYLLEVSSPGVERELTRTEHFAACAGEKVELRLFAPVDGSRVYTGILRGLDPDGQVLVEVGGTVRAFPRSSVSKIKTVFDF